MVYAFALSKYTLKQKLALFSPLRPEFENVLSSEGLIYIVTELILLLTWTVCRTIQLSLQFTVYLLLSKVRGLLFVLTIQILAVWHFETAGHL